MVRRSVEAHRRESGTARMRELDQEIAWSANGHQRWGDHHVDLGTGCAMGAEKYHDGCDGKGENHDNQYQQES
jgi:hypothetical protein